MTAAADASALAQIRRLVERGLANRAPFVELHRAAAVLVVARGRRGTRLAPLGRAGDGRARDDRRADRDVSLCAGARRARGAGDHRGRLTSIGVLSTRADALERLAAANVAALDKTGTLTEGTSSLERVEAFGGLERAGALRIAAMLETGSAHPAARAIAALGAGLPDAAVRATETAGGGVAGKVGDEAWRIGTPEFAAAGAALPAEALEAVERARGEGLLPVVLADGDGLGRGAVFGLAERWREDAGVIASALRRKACARRASLR